jgi:hypothetical protein
MLKMIEINLQKIYEIYEKSGIGQAARKFGKSKALTRYYLKKFGYKLSNLGPRSKKFDENYFQTINCEPKAYFLGLLAADGHISSKRNAIRFCLSQKDEEILYSFKKCLKSESEIKTYTNNKNFTYSVFQVSSKKMKNDLSKLGVVPNKTFILKWPCGLPEQFERDFIRGYIDGDGCWFIKKGKRKFAKDKKYFGLQIAGASKTILSSIEESLRKNCDTIKKEVYYYDNQKYYELKYGHGDSIKIYDFLYPSDVKFFLKRKMKKRLQVVI